LTARRSPYGPLEIEPSDLKNKMDSGENLYILDVRTPEEYKSWKISYDKHVEPSLVPLDKLSSDEQIRNIPRDREVITVCSHGMRSKMAAEYLSQLGYNAKSIRGGMVAWNKINDLALIPSKADLNLKIWQIRRISKGCMTYLISYLNNAVVIDPPCSSAASIYEIAKKSNLRIKALIETHRHADHLSASMTLAKETGAILYLSPLEEYETEQTITNGLNINFLNDGQRIEISNGLTLDVIHTPGHTVGSMSFQLDALSDGNERGERETFLFSGDTLFVDGIGRPDLHDKVDEFSRTLFLTYKKLASLPDSAIVLPSHYSKSMKHEDPIFKTIGEIKAYLKAFRMDEDEFINYVASSIPPQPMNYKRILRLNKDLLLCNNLHLDDLEAGPNSCGIQG
jgi:glyoxylase-like metal-dependent hydrolase (beta-lactamase superfamily II)/rhodanese-related sulfurtransferase